MNPFVNPMGPRGDTAASIPIHRFEKMKQASGIMAFTSLAIAACIMLAGAFLAALLASGANAG